VDDGFKVRTHGFIRPFHPLQVVSWVVFGSDVFVYLLFCLPIIDTVGARVFVALVYVASILLLVLSTVKATMCDPADPHVRLQPSEILKSEKETMPYCSVCDVPVNRRSKHCRTCNKCVTVFDHHCMWLNNCVGGTNYHAFFASISSVAVMIGIVLCTCLYLIIDYFVNNDGFQGRLRDTGLFASFPKEFFLVLLLIMMFLNLPLFVLDTQLVFLHLFLASQQLTTYEYIINKSRPGDDDASSNSPGMALRRQIKTLPHCMDWIVFSRCGQRRRKKKKNGIERIATQEDAEDTKAAPKAAAAGSPQVSAAKAEERPSPPGSTFDAAALESGEGCPATPSHINGMEVDSQICCDHAASSPRSERCAKAEGRPITSRLNAGRSSPLENGEGGPATPSHTHG